jgi:DNA-directed RNA polymerase I subunit RPA43
MVCKFTTPHRVTVANEMLSLLGSLQTDPFSPEHGGSSTKSVLGESEIEDIEVEREIEPSAEEEDQIEDTFEILGSGDVEKKKKRKRDKIGNCKPKRKKMNVVSS